MIIKEIRLRNFRNFENCHVFFNSNLTIITGLNGQGKTNLLESLIFLSTTHSHRINDDKKLIMFSKEFSNIDCIYEDNDINYQLSSVIHQKGKTLFINKKIISKSSEFIGMLNTILFSPSDINIFDESPKERRKILNIEIIKVSKRYLDSLNNYQKLLKERNLYLKNKVIDSIYMSTLEEKMIENQLVILDERYKFIDEINKYINSYFKKLINEDYDINVEYLGCVKKENLENTKELLKKMYENSRKKDSLLMNTSCGIHRDDILFKINNENVNDVASQGQRRLVVIALKLSLINYIKNKTNKVPILLLDDVLSELDIEKQKNLLSCIDYEIQTIITTSVVSESLKNVNSKLNIKVIDSGKVKEIKNE